MDTVHIGDIEVSRFILGSNPFSGFSHQGPEMDSEMMRYHTSARIKETLANAESLGVNTMIGRTDYHVIRVLMEYWGEGGEIQWFAQTCPEVGSHEMCIERAASNGAKACHLHGGVMDHLLANGGLEEIPQVVDSIRERGMLAGMAGHRTEVFEWAEENLDLDYYMCSYYNPIPRDANPEHVSGLEEVYSEEDRARMTASIQNLSKPVIHYKIMAAGRNIPQEAFAFLARNMRPQDAVCVGIYAKDRPGMLQENVGLLEGSLAVCAK